MKNSNDDQVSALVVLKALQDEAAPLMRKLNRIEKITNKDSYSLAMAQMKSLKELGKLAKAKEDSLTEPLKKVTEDIKGLFKPFRSVVTDIEVNLKQQMVEYLNEQERLEKKLLADFESGKVKSVKAFAIKSAELSVQKAGARKLFRAEAVDVSKTPREYMQPNVLAITAALKEGKKVAGWILIEEKSIAI